MADVDPIVVQILTEGLGELKADLAKVNKEIKGFGKETDKASKSGKGFKGTNDGILLGIKRLRADLGAVTFATGALTGAVIAMTAAQVSAALETERWAKNLGITSGALSELSGVAKKFGGSTDDVGDSIKDLNERIADAAGGAKTYEEALQKAGVSSKELFGLSADVQFLKVADAIGKMNDAGDQNFVTAELMGDAGFRLIEMFRQGEEGIAAMRKELVATGEVMSGDEIEIYTKFGKELNQTWTLSKGLFDNIATSVLPVFDNALFNINKVIAETNRLFGDTNEELSSMAPNAQGAAIGIKKLNDAMETGALATMQTRLASSKERLIELKGALGSAFSESHKLVSPLVERIALLEKHLSNIGNLGVPDAMRSAIEGVGGTIEDASAGVNVNTDGEKGLGEIDKSETGMEIRQGQLDAILNQEFEHMLKLSEQNATARELEETAHKEWLDRMFGDDKRAQDQNAALWEAGWKGKQMVASKFLGGISQLMNTNSKKQFEIGKAAAIAQVAIDTPKAAMSAYASMAGIPLIGPALGVAAAGAAIASGVSQIQNIKSQSFGGGGSAGGGGITADAGGAGAQQQAPENVIDATFNIAGDSMSMTSARGMLGSLNELIEDGGTLRSVKVI